MKKNRMMRLASILLVCVLMTTSVISGTFAKYTTSVESQDSARVANWGFERTNSMDITGLFSKAYNESVNAVVDVIAPGTTGSATFGFAYDETNGNAPEVDYTFVVDTAGSTCADSIKNNPNILWKLDQTEYVPTNEKTSWDQLLDAINAMDGNKDQYDAGELPENFGTTDTMHTISWRWIFSNSEANDTTDTGMGNADELAEVKIVISITATQVD